MKKTLALILSLFLALTLFGCGGSSSGSKTAKEYNIGVTIYQFDDNFMTLYRNDITAYFDELNKKDANTQYKVTIVDAANDMATQTEQVDSFITQKVDVMIVNLVQTSSGETIAKKCEEAGIPVVFINREMADYTYPDNQCYVGADAKQSGTYQGEIIAALDNHGDLDGDGQTSYVMIMGDPENSDAQYRTEYSIKALEDAGVKVNKLYQETGNWAQDKGQELVATALSQFGTKVEVVFCNNDAMALGAYQAITAAGRTVGKDIYLVGVDALAECVKMVQEGTMTGTVLNDDAGQATAACDTAVGYINGTKPEKEVNYIPYVKVTKDNAADYIK